MPGNGFIRPGPHSWSDEVMKLLIAPTDTMCIFAGGKICADSDSRDVITVCVRRVVDTGDKSVRLVVHASKQMDAKRSAVIQAARGIGIFRVCSDRWILCRNVLEEIGSGVAHKHGCRGRSVLLDVLAIRKEEQLILDDRTADATAKLVALETVG